MIAYEKASKAVLGLGSPDQPSFARGEQNFDRFAALLNTSLGGKTWLVGTAHDRRFFHRRFRTIR
jgi:glutathione S-transferase